MWSTNWAPLRLEPPSNEILRGIRLFLLGEMRHEQLLATVGECTKPAPWAALCLVAEALAKEIRMVEELRSTVAASASISTGAGALIVELLITRLSAVAGMALTFIKYKTPAVSLAVEEGTAAVVVGGHGTLQSTWQGLKLTDHFIVLDLLLLISRRQGRCTQESNALRHVWRQGTEKSNVSLICLPAHHGVARQNCAGCCTSTILAARSNATVLPPLASTVPPPMGGATRVLSNRNFCACHDFY